MRNSIIRGLIMAFVVVPFFAIVGNAKKLKKSAIQLLNQIMNTDHIVNEFFNVSSTQVRLMKAPLEKYAEEIQLIEHVTSRSADIERASAKYWIKGGKFQATFSYVIEGVTGTGETISIRTEPETLFFAFAPDKNRFKWDIKDLTWLS